MLGTRAPFRTYNTVRHLVWLAKMCPWWEGVEGSADSLLSAAP